MFKPTEKLKKYLEKFWGLINDVILFLNNLKRKPKDSQFPKYSN